jgi:predicted nucleic acid-binding protein
VASEARASVDANILLYAIDASEADKQAIALETLDGLWSKRTGTLSTQVLQEFYSVATRKLSPPVSRDDARKVLAAHAAWPVVLVDTTMILAATRIEEEHQLSFWDALILEAARVAGAEHLLTEDLQHGRVIEGVRIVNPFRDRGLR